MRAMKPWVHVGTLDVPCRLVTRRSTSAGKLIGLNSLEALWTHVGIIEKEAKKPIRPMTVQKLMQTNSYGDTALVKSAEWVREELIVRFAHRIQDFHRLPFVALANPFVMDTYKVYLETFENLHKRKKITTRDEERDFSEFLNEWRPRHDRTVDYMGQGVRQLRAVAPDVGGHMNWFLERFFYFRISRRVMVDHLMARKDPKAGWRGSIQLSCNPALILKSRAEAVKESCRNSYGLAPPFHLHGNLDVTFAYFPDHLSLICTELLKNAMRATVEMYTMGNSMVPSNTIVIKIADKGGGIPPRNLENVWNYGYSTVDDSHKKMAERGGSLTGANTTIGADMAGYGFGLPLSRAFARFFGGDIHIQSHFGVGTDVYLTVSHIGDEAEALAAVASAPTQIQEHFPRTHTPNHHNHSHHPTGNSHGSDFGGSEGYTTWPG